MIKDFFETFIQLGDPVVITDEQHQILMVNEAYEHASGYYKEELLGKAAGVIKSGLTPQHVYDSMKTTLIHSEVWKGILTNKRPDGELWNSSVTITPIKLPNRLYYIGVCRDVQDITQQNIAESYEQLFLGIAHIAEANDPSLEIHLRRVSQLTEIIGTAIHLPYKQIQWIKIASILHDVGKVFIPKEILFKPGKLTNGEKELIKTHTTLGGELIQTLHDSMSKIYGYNEAMVFAKEVACSHHERYDGKGYPHRLTGEVIPLSARIVSLADVVDALMSTRPYKKAWKDQEVYSYLELENGNHFDPELAYHVLQNWEKIKAVYHDKEEATL